MTYAMIQETDVPKVKGNPEAVETAGTDLTTASGADGGVASASSSITSAWAGLTESNYNAPESPAVFQSVPKVSSPLEKIQTNMDKVGKALSDAGTTLGTLKTRSATLKTDVRDFVRRANDMDEFARAGGSIDDEVWSSWRDAPGLQAENDRLWTRATTLQTDIDEVGNELSRALSGISAPNPTLPDASFEAGVPSGNRASAEGPGASANAWSGTTWQNGNWYAAAGAEAEAHLFDASANGSVDTAVGTFHGDASVNVGARADASANMSVGVDGVHARAEANASFGVEAKANAGWDGPGSLSADVGVRATAGGEAKASAGLDVGADGVSANVGGSAFIGGKVEVDGSVGVDGAKANVGANVRYGIGVEADADLKVTPDEVKVKLKFGASLGLGAGVDLDVSIKPKELASTVKGWFGF